MPRSEASRQRDRDRVREWRKKNPEKAKANTRRAWKKFAPKAAAQRALQRAIAKRLAGTHSEGPRGFWQTAVSKLDHPALKYLDRHGVVRVEEELSAEQLIARWQRKKNR